MQNETHITLPFGLVDSADYRGFTRRSTSTLEVRDVNGAPILTLGIVPPREHQSDLSVYGVPFVYAPGVLIADGFLLRRYTERWEELTAGMKMT